MGASGLRGRPNGDRHGGRRLVIAAHNRGCHQNPVGEKAQCQQQQRDVCTRPPSWTEPCALLRIGRLLSRDMSLDQTPDESDVDYLCELRALDQTLPLYTSELRVDEHELWADRIQGGV